MSETGAIANLGKILGDDYRFAPAVAYLLLSLLVLLFVDKLPSPHDVLFTKFAKVITPFRRVNSFGVPTSHLSFSSFHTGSGVALFNGKSSLAGPHGTTKCDVVDTISARPACCVFPPGRAWIHCGDGSLPHTIVRPRIFTTAHDCRPAFIHSARQSQSQKLETPRLGPE
jgi:hypothetical protein